MEDKIIELAECLVKAYKLKEELYNKEYWINKASKETDFVPAEGDWIHVEVTLFRIEVSVHHKESGGAKYWKNGVWSNDPFSSKYPLPEKMLDEMKDSK